MKKIRLIIDLIKNMGIRYLIFRINYEFLRKSGLQKKRFPLSVRTPKDLPTLSDWKKNKGTFFFENKKSLTIPKFPDPLLEEKYNEFKNGIFTFFSGTKIKIGRDYDWVSNPDSGYRYSKNIHWSQIQSFSKASGDIKYVWEKSRFCFLLDLIRYDYHYDKDLSGEVFDEIISWIEANPLNHGPNYVCSQEISLRLLNWIFALNYYSDSESLTDSAFNKIIVSIYGQLHHVYKNINFSRISVRNNHAITETLTLFISGLIFPQVQDFQKWSRKGKQWLEKEILYQVYPDGSYLQHSMNYHRVVVQLLSWGIRLGELNKNNLSPLVHERSVKTLFFLRTCMEDSTGHTPNYGPNDGALFFKFSDKEFRNYKPQIQAFSNILGIDPQIDEVFEDTLWLGTSTKIKDNLNLQNISSFPFGGYYVVREKDSMLFIRCAKYKDRPHQADNLHLDFWYKGKNILRDAGSYKYNATPELMEYFNGTASHNTLQIENNDQMLKGSRFIWYYWSQSKGAEILEENDKYIFSGEINAFKYLKKNIYHRREIIKYKNQPKIIISDEITGISGKTIVQNWHIPLHLETYKVDFISQDEQHKPLNFEQKEGWYSGLYGKKEPSKTIAFQSKTRNIKTTIEIAEDR